MRTHFSFILLGLLLFISCSKERKFLNTHHITLVANFNDGNEVLTKEAETFEKNHNIKFQQANKIYEAFRSNNEKDQIKAKDSFKFYPTLIIDEYYVYSFKNLKAGKIAVFGIGVNANTGEPKNFTEEIWLHEKNILKK